MNLAEYLTLTDTPKDVHLLFFNDEDELECFSYKLDDPIEPEFLYMIVEEINEDIDYVEIWLREEK